MQIEEPDLPSDGIVAVHVEGNLCRNGEISLIAVGSGGKSRAAIFGAGAAPLGEPRLKELLESTDVVKIFHDCRSASDALFHLLDISLCNVLDTQVLWSLLHPTHNQRAGLSSVLRKYSGQGGKWQDEIGLETAMLVLFSGNVNGATGGGIARADNIVKGLIAAASKMLNQLPLEEVKMEVLAKCSAQLQKFRDQPGQPLDTLQTGVPLPFRFDDDGCIVLDVENVAADDTTSDDTQYEQDSEKFLGVLPLHLRKALRPRMRRLVDLVLDVGELPVVRFRSKEGKVTAEDLDTEWRVTSRAVASICKGLDQFDSQERAGIPGTLHRISRIRREGKTVGLTMRFAVGVGPLPLLLDVAASGKSDTQYEQDSEKFLGVLPLHLREALRPRMSSLVDLLLDVGELPVVRSRSKEGKITAEDLGTEWRVTSVALESICKGLDQFDSQERAGIPGTLHRISRIRREGETVGLTMRFAVGVGSLPLLLDVAASGKSVLLLGGPGVGKTTILRGMAADRSLRQAVMIVEASKEIAGAGSTCHPCVGRSRRLLTQGGRESRHETMVQAVENHTPECLVVDEIGMRREVQMARTISARGVQIVGTAHGKDLPDLLRNGEINGLLGGTQEVILAQADARYDGVNKVVTERKEEPVFDVLVEVRSPHSVLVHWDIRSSVDSFLRGGRPEVELREADASSGQRFITKVRCTGYDGLDF